MVQAFKNDKVKRIHQHTESVYLIKQIQINPLSFVGFTIDCLSKWITKK